MDRGVWQGVSQRVKHNLAHMQQELYFQCRYILPGAFLVAQMVKNLPAMWETQVPNPGLRKSSGKEKGNPLQYSCLENPMDRGAWWATVYRVAQS